jgi:type III pantothenate kinase
LSFTGNCLQLDVGNSGAKWRLMHGDKVVSRGIYRADDVVSQALLLQCCDDLQHIWISSVAAPITEEKLTFLLAQQWDVSPWFARSEAQTGDLINSYTDASRMGVDRWLAMLGARERAQSKLCVIDAGSALTIDIVSTEGQHEGGYIIPGLALMERALLLDTDRVRFDEQAEYTLAPGRSTAEAVRHGLAVAQAGAVALAVEQAGSEPMALFFCGGYGEALMQLLQLGGEWTPDLVFEGLAIMATLRLGFGS